MKAEYIAACSTKSLPKIRAFMEEKLREMEVQENLCHQLILAVDEACANSIIHQNRCNEMIKIQVSVYRKKDSLFIELKDKGTPFPITDYKPEDLHDIIKNRTKGGLGIYLITRIMDKIEIVPHKDEFIYRFVKSLR